MVASRPSTIALADEVVYLAGGQVVDHGPHADLMARRPATAALVEAFETDRRRRRRARRRARRRGRRR